MEKQERISSVVMFFGGYILMAPNFSKVLRMRLRHTKCMWGCIHFRVNMYLPPVIWASSGFPPVKKKFRFQPCKIRFFDFSP